MVDSLIYQRLSNVNSGNSSHQCHPAKPWLDGWFATMAMAQAVLKLAMELMFSMHDTSAKFYCLTNHVPTKMVFVFECSIVTIALIFLGTGSVAEVEVGGRVRARN